MSYSFYLEQEKEKSIMFSKYAQVLCKNIFTAYAYHEQEKEINCVYFSNVKLKLTIYLMIIFHIRITYSGSNP